MRHAKGGERLHLLRELSLRKELSLGGVQLGVMFNQTESYTYPVMIAAVRATLSTLATCLLTLDFLNEPGSGRSLTRNVGVL
jgi:hypothetical protein